MTSRRRHVRVVSRRLHLPVRLDRRRCRGVAVALSTILCVACTAHAWGDKTHPAVNRLALETLPSPPALFIEHADDLARRSNEPDTVMRGRDGDAEKIRHFIDLDELMLPPFTGFPRTYREAVRRFGKERVEHGGVLPWVILRFQRQMREAIRAGDQRRIVREAAYLGHYAADACLPLHVTKNHDGQLTGATGLHKRYEDGLVDARIETYVERARSHLRRAAVLEDPRDGVFEALFESYRGVNTILVADAAGRERASAGTPDYFEQFDELAGELTARRLAAAATLLGSLWWTAWEQEHGGRP